MPGERRERGGEAFSRHYNDEADQAGKYRSDQLGLSLLSVNFFPGLRGPVPHTIGQGCQPDLGPWDGVFIGLVRYLFAAGPLF